MGIRDLAPPPACSDVGEALFDLKTGRQRQLTNLQPGSSLRSFDVSADGKSILFDRVRENSDIVLIELPGR